MGGGDQRRRRGAARAWVLPALLVTGALLSLAVAVLYLRARPVPQHPFFAGMPDRPLVIAHRGSAILWPENTIHAFREALELGSDLIELDLRTTADGEIVVLHDATVDRTTDGTGRVNDIPLEELRRLDAGHRFRTPGTQSFPERGRGHTVPTLAAVLTELPTARMNLELKEASPELARRLCELLREHGAQNRALVASFHDSVVRAFRQRCPEVATSATASEAKRFLLASLLPGTLYVPAAHAIQLPERFRGVTVVNRRTAERARAANLPMHAFTINDPEVMRRLLQRGVAGLVTDRPDLALEQVAPSRSR